MSRVYLGVHYPSDILGGWSAALVWVVGLYLLLFRGERRPRWRAHPDGTGQNVEWRGVAPSAQVPAAVADNRSLRG